MPGVEIHANTVDMLLRGTFVRPVSGEWILMLFLAIGLAGGFLPGRRLWILPGVFGTLVVACLTLGYQLFASFDLWLTVAGPVASAPMIWGIVAICALVVERREKDFVRSTLERYVSPAVVEDVVSQGIDIALGGRRVLATVLFSDVRGFTSMSERIPPEVLVDLSVYSYAASMNGLADQDDVRLRFDVLIKTKQPELHRYWTTRDRAANVRLFRLASEVLGAITDRGA